MRNKFIAAAVCLAVLTMTGCGGASKEKIEEVQAVYAQLVTKHNEVIDAYAEVEDESLRDHLDQMAEQINTIGNQEMKKKTDEEIDEIIVELKKNIVSYEDILASIHKMDSQASKIQSLPLTIKNNTGSEISQLYLYEVSSEEKGNNLVEGLGTLGNEDTMNLLSLYILDNKKMWHMEAYNKSEKSILSENVDFTGCKEDGNPVQMEINSDALTLTP